MTDPHSALVLLVSIVGGGVVSVIGIATWSRARQLARWRRAADTLGLVLTCETVTRIPRLRGRLDGFDVEVDVSRSRDELHFVVESPDLPRDISLRRLPLGLVPRRLTGDSAFDVAVVAEGGRARLAALFESEVREELLEHIERGKGEYVFGRLLARRLGRGATAREIIVRVRKQVALAGRLRRLNLDWLPRLAGRCREQSDVEERLACLEALVEDFPETTEAGRSLEAALADRELRCRLYAADVLGRADVLEAVARDAQADPHLRVSALELFYRHSVGAEVVNVVEALLASADDELVQLAIDYARRVRLAEVRSQICRLAMSEQVSVAVRAPAIEALGDLAGPSYGGAIAALLDGNDDEVVAAVCRALVHLGQPEHLPHLRALKKRASRGRWLWRGAAAAINAIERRAHSELSGGLALVSDVDGGDLSLAEELGAIALVDDPDG